MRIPESTSDTGETVKPTVEEPSESAASEPRKARRITIQTPTGPEEVGLLVGTRYPDRAAFVQRFSRMVGPGGMFIATSQPLAVGEKLTFAVTLADQTVMFKGQVEVLEVRAEPRGLRLRFLSLSDPSRAMLDELLAARAAASTAEPSGRHRSSSPGVLPAGIPVGSRPTSPGLAVALDAPPSPEAAPVPAPPWLAVTDAPARTDDDETRPGPSRDDQPAKARRVNGDEFPIAARHRATEVLPVVPPPTRAAEGRARVSGSMPAVQGGTPSGPRGAELRTPGSPVILEANPLAEIGDEELRAFIDGTMDGTPATLGAAPAPNDPEFEALARIVTPTPPSLRLPEARPRLPTPAPGQAPRLMTSQASGFGPAAAVAEAPSPDPALRSTPPFTRALTTSQPGEPRPAPPRLAPALAEEEPPSRNLIPVLAFVLGLVTAALSVLILIGRVPGMRLGAPPPAEIQPAPPPPPPPAPIVIHEQAPPPPARCSIEVTSKPDAIAFRIDGNLRGATPTRIDDLECGKEYDVVIANPSFSRFERKVTPLAGQPAKVDANLSRLAPRLLIESDPSGATVKLDGQEVGKTPLTREVRFGARVVIEVSAEGRRPWSSTVKIHSQFSTVSPVLDAAE